MRTQILCFAGLLLAVAGRAYAQSDALPDVTLSGVAVTHTEAAVSVKPGESSKVGHLQKAADHLEAAGLADEAKRLRHQAQLLDHRQQLQQKLKDLHKLQKEVRELYRLTGVGQQIQVDVKIIEIDLDKLEAAGVKLCEVSGNGGQCCRGETATKPARIVQAAASSDSGCSRCKANSEQSCSSCQAACQAASKSGTSCCTKDAATCCTKETSCGTSEKSCCTTKAACCTTAKQSCCTIKKQPAHEQLFDDDGELTETGRRLQKAGVVKIIASPSLITTPGRPANLLTGGEFPILVAQPSGGSKLEWRAYGTQVETVTALMPDGRIRLELQAEASDRDSKNAVELNGKMVPGLTTRRVRAEVLACSGETVLIGGQGSLETHEKTADGKIHKKCLRVAVTPKLLSVPVLPSPESARVLPNPPPAKRANKTRKGRIASSPKN